MTNIGKKIGFVGYGNMGSALVKGIINKGKNIIPIGNIYVYDKAPEKIEEAKAAGIKTLTNALELFNTCDIVFLCVKPKDLTSSLETLKEAINMGNKTYLLSIEKKVLVSILAGVRVEKIEEAIGYKIPIVRVMPNAPALVGEGAFGIFFSDKVSSEDRKTILSIFGNLGVSIVVEDEQLIDVVTGLSGSGPAYVFLVISALADGGVRMGLSRNDALLLSAQTVLGSARMVLENIGKIHPEALKDMVMSPGGTTAEGLKTLEENKVRFAFIKAVEEATKKSREISK